MSRNYEDTFGENFPPVPANGKANETQLEDPSLKGGEKDYAE